MAKATCELTYNEVRKDIPRAWNALPECYKEDSCLTFFLDVNEHLCAENDSGQTFVFDEASEEWIEG